MGSSSQPIFWLWKHSVTFYEKGININKGYELACIHGVSAFRVLAPNMNIARMPIEEIGKNAVRILLGDIKYRLENSTEKKK